MGDKLVVTCTNCGPQELNLSSHTIRMDVLPSGPGEVPVMSVVFYCPECNYPIVMGPNPKTRGRLRVFVERFLSYFGVHHG